MSAAAGPKSSALPADLLGVLADLERADQDASQLVSSLNQQQLNWQPGGGARWSVAQCLDHLARMNTVYTAALLEAVQRANRSRQPRRGPIRPGWLSRWFIQSLEPPPRLKLKSPKKGRPAAYRKGAEVLEAFMTAHDKVRSLVDDARELDLNRIRFKNPFIRLLRFTVGTGLLVIAAHDRRHLWQAQQACIAAKAAAAGGTV